MLIRYARNKNRQKIGIVVAMGKGKIGWSSCWQGDEDDPWAEPRDVWNQKLGLRIAIGRALRGSKKRIPDELLRTVVESYQAAERFFKQEVV